MDRIPDEMKDESSPVLPQQSKTQKEKREKSPAAIEKEAASTEDTTQKQPQKPKVIKSRGPIRIRSRYRRRGPKPTYGKGIDRRRLGGGKPQSA